VGSASVDALAGPVITTSCEHPPPYTATARDTIRTSSGIASADTDSTGNTPHDQDTSSTTGNTATTSCGEHIDCADYLHIT